MPSLGRRLTAEALGTAFLLATVIGSGIMAESLAGGSQALALLGNTIATGAILYVLIVQFGPISGAHFNPAVTLVLVLRGETQSRDAVPYLVAQVVGAVAGVVVAHLMFDRPPIEMSEKIRTGPAQWFAEAVATFGLVSTILLTSRTRREAVPMAVALYITAAYWFTASTSFANPAVTFARSLSDSFAGIRLVDVPAFAVTQLVGAVAAFVACRWLVNDSSRLP